MAPTLSPSVASQLHTYITSFTTGPSPALPGAILQVLDSRGKALFSHATSPQTPQTLYSIHSLSKLIGAIAFLQLVDRGLASLDDPQLIEKYLPELAAKKVLLIKDGPDGEKEYSFEERKGEITARTLMNHTNGTGMSFFNAELRDYLVSTGIDIASTHEGSEYWKVLLASPLLWQPGEKTNYGQGMDWLSVLVERVTGRALEEVLREGVFAPLGIERAGFRGEWGGSVVAGPEVPFWPANFRLGDGSFVGVPGFAEKKVEWEDGWPKGKTHVQSAATGLVMCVADYARVLVTLLPENAGVDPVSGTRILSAASAAEFAKIQHAEAIRNDSRNIPTASPLFKPCEVQAVHVDPTGCFGLGSAIQGEDRASEGGKRGRSKGSVYWLGASNSAYWIDGAKGVVAVMTGNFFPFMDEKWVEFQQKVEGLIYEGLQE